MYIEQLYTNCLAEAAYYIESNGEAAIIDPMREIEPYLSLSLKRNAKIKYIFETHFHADFVSGHIDIARKTGAEIIYGPTASAAYQITVAEDCQEFPLGNIYIKLLHTPGHTMESSCLLVIDENGKEHAVFTGDTLFIGDVGRPDLAVKSDVSVEDLAGYLYNSINEKLMVLSDDIVLYPGHGAGSQCGKNMSTERVSTIGDQKRLNYALQVGNKADFIKAVTNGLSSPPQYFPKNANINKQGYDSIEVVLGRAEKALSTIEFCQAIQQNEIIIIDSRSAAIFSKGFVHGSVNIGLDGSFAVWLGTLVENLQIPILIVSESGKEQETALRMARVGYENIVGHLDGGLEAWSSAGLEVKTISNSCPVDFNNNPEAKSVIDVRNPAEYEDGHVKAAINLPLNTLPQELSGLDKSAVHYIYCKSGYRSMVASSILKKNGFENIVNVKKGYEGIIDTSKTCCCSKTMLSAQPVL